MQVKEGSFINILGRLDEDTWEDPTTHEKKSAMVVILDEIEYCASGGNRQQKENAGAPAPAQQTNSSGSVQQPADPAAAPATGNAGGNFTGYEPFGGINSFFDE